MLLEKSLEFFVVVYLHNDIISDLTDISDLDHQTDRQAKTTENPNSSEFACFVSFLI